MPIRLIKGGLEDKNNKNQEHKSCYAYSDDNGLRFFSKSLCEWEHTTLWEMIFQAIGERKNGPGSNSHMTGSVSQCSSGLAV